MDGKVVNSGLLCLNIAAMFFHDFFCVLKDLCEAFYSVDIPWNSLKKFVENRDFSLQCHFHYR
jgi:hypothetical protein